MALTYKTVQGDMWDMIAYKQMGSTDYTGNLMRANSSLVGTYVFDAGVELTIPDVSEETAPTLPPWKQVSG